MDVLEEKVAEIKSVLTRAAKSRSIVRYPKIYSLFEDDENKTIIWATFEQACREIADPSEAIYGVLMSCLRTAFSTFSKTCAQRNIKNSPVRTVHLAI